MEIQVLLADERFDEFFLIFPMLDGLCLEGLKAVTWYRYQRLPSKHGP